MTASCVTERSRRGKLLGGVVGAAGIILLSASAQAQISTIQLVYANDYRQTATNAYTNFGAYLQPVMLVQNANNVSLVECESPDEDIIELDTFGGGAYIGTFGTYSTQATLMSTYGAGTYTMSWSGGSLGSGSYPINQPFANGIWPSQFPRFTPTTFTSAQGMDPSQPFTFALASTFTPDPASQARTGGFYISTVQPSGLPGGIVYSQLVSDAGVTATSRVLPANTLQPGTQYFVTWLYANAISNSPPGIGSVRVEFRVTTRLLFTTGTPVPTCDSVDFNRDTLTPDSGDLDDFLAVLSGGPSACSNAPNCGDVDFNNDGFSPDSLDLDAFVSRLGGGPCLQ